MDSCLSYSKPSVLNSLSFSAKTLNFSSFQVPYGHRWISSRLTFKFYGDSRSFRPIISGSRTYRRVAVSAGAGSHCEFGGSLNTPLEPKSRVGRLLSGVLQNDRESFHSAVAEQLGQLVACRDEAVARMRLSLGSDEAGLHRRIAELKEQECRTAIEDILYMFIFHKFSEIRVHLVPSFSKCIYNGRLEIWPSKDWELESIHSYDVLEMIREHLTTVVGWKAKSGVTENWTTTQIQRLDLCRIYVASILYGYFLKSASLRHHLELRLKQVKDNFGFSNIRSLQLSELSECINNIVFGHISKTSSASVGQVSYTRIKKQENLRYYVMTFDPETLQICARPKSVEAVNLIEKHSAALFGDEKTGSLETSGVISTSVACLKRLVLEAIAFGSFLWDAEEFVNTVYKLDEY